MSSALARPQSFANHRAFPPLWFFLIGLVLMVEAGQRAWLAFQAPGFWSVWAVLVALAWFGVWVASRMRAQIVQDRVIRLEMELRLERLLGPARRAEVAKLELDQLIALRFAGDAELPALLARVTAGELVRRDDIKRGVKDWQADWLRV